MHRFVQHGLSMFTWGDNPTPHEQAFEAIKAGIDSLPPGVKMFLNSGTWIDWIHYLACKVSRPQYSIFSEHRVIVPSVHSRVTF